MNANARKVFVIATGTANTASVLAGLRRAGAEPELTREPAVVRDASHIMVPGVGAFAAAMDALSGHSLVEPLSARIAANRPTLAICLGLQLFAAESDESIGARGLGIFPQRCTRFPDTVNVPHFGWNRVTAAAGCRLLRDGYAYFANSYRLTEVPAGWCVATTEYAGPFVAAVERGPVLACQFHPELSGRWGLELLQRWLQTTDEPTNRAEATATEPAQGAGANAPC